ncbi:MAG TPA: HD domain-containing protein [Candidatus Dojkabacteria bacterium]
MKFPALENKKIAELMKRFDGYLVGGYVRDCVLGREAKDIDICSIKTPDKIDEILRRFNYKYRVHGKSYGVFVVTLSEGFEIELSAARRDFNHDGRQCKVEFVKTIEEDLARRDLTVNSIAVDVNGNIIDPFGGLKDIERKTIKFVGSAEDRIEEDNLRAFRALRFSFQLGFDLPPETVSSINKYSLDVAVRARELVLSPERMRDEIIKILNNYKSISDIHWDCFCLLLESTGLPVMATRGCPQPESYHEFDVYTHTEKVVSFSEGLVVRLSSLLHDLGKPASIKFKDGEVPTFKGHDKVSANIAETWLTKLKFPSNIIRDVTDIVNYHMMTIGDTNKSKIKAVKKFSSSEVFEMWGQLRIADRLGKGNRLKEGVVEEELRLIREALNVEEKQPLKLEVSGFDVMQLFGLKPGKEVGDLLNSCRELVMEDPANNNREVLLNHLRGIKNA